MAKKKKTKEKYPHRISLKVEKELHEKLLALAEKEDRSLNNLIRQLLWRVFSDEEKK